MFSVPMTKRKAVRGDGLGRERAEEEAEVVEEEVEEAAVLAEALASSILLILCSISVRLLCHCLRRGKRRAVPDATLGTETKTSKWLDALLLADPEDGLNVILDFRGKLTASALFSCILRM